MNAISTGPVVDRNSGFPVAWTLPIAPMFGDMDYEEFMGPL